MTKHLPKLSFYLLILLILILAVATFIEKAQGTSFVYDVVYGSWWFCGVWAVLVLLCVIGIIKGKMYRNLSVFTVHISFIIILISALFTKLTSEQGIIILNKNEAGNLFQADDEAKLLPFQLKLDTFYVENYPGTNAPADYVSRITVIDSIAKETKSGVVSMNNIFEYGGYRFYQSSFDESWDTSVLSINRDIIGIPLSYSGYALFVIGMIWCLLSPKNTFRKLLRHPLLKKAIVLLLILLPTALSAQTITKDSLTLSRKQADEFGNLWMLYDGRITPVATFARDFMSKLTGKTSFSYLNANQFLCAFLFFPEKWQQVALFEVNDPELKKLLQAEHEKAALMHFFDENGAYKLGKYASELSKGGQKSSRIKEVEKLNEKVQLIEMLHNGYLLQLYPLNINGEVKWYYPTQNLHTKEERENTDMIRKSLLEYYREVHSGNEQQAFNVLRKIDEFQRKNAGKVLPSDKHRDIEIFYLKANISKILFMVNLTFGMLALLGFFVLSGKKQQKLNAILSGFLILSFLVHTVNIGLRTYIAGRLPFSNGYETMLLIAWCALLMAVLFRRRIPIVMPFGFLLSGFTLLVAYLSAMNPKITPLVPVLSSPLLSIHVSTIMLSYTLLAFIALNSLYSIILLLVSRNGKENVLLQLERNKIYSQLCLYPALLFLGAGIFIGAVWANISWGRYWGWDPKEVWALITFLVYGLMAHEKILMPFRRPFFFHVFGLFAFSTVLMTYFGVNYFLGGMHSYAGEMEIGKIGIIIAGSVIVLSVLCVLGYRSAFCRSVGEQKCSNGR